MVVRRNLFIDKKKKTTLVYLEAESPCQFPVFQTTHFGALVRLLFHELLGLQLRRLLRWSSIGAREGFYLLCSLLLEPRRLNYHCTYDHAYDSVPLLACGPCLGRVMRGVCAVSSDEGPCARHASRALRRACGQGAVLSLCMVRPGSGRFGVGFWVGFWVGLRARDFPTERVLSRTPLIIRTVDQNQRLSIPPPGGVRGWVRGYGGVGLWKEGPGCAYCEDYD